MNARYLLPFIKSYQVQEPSSKAELRLKWIDYYKIHKNFALTSRHFDIPEPTVRYWIKRYQKLGFSSLEDRSKRPHKVKEPQISEDTIELILTIRKKHPYLGKTKIQTLLKKEGINVGQSRIQKTINHFNLKRKKRLRVRKRTSRKHIYTAPKTLQTTPGGIVCIDVKHITLLGGKQAYQFTAIDKCTRMTLAKMYSRISSNSGLRFFKYLQETFPFKILSIGSDNGSENLGELDKYLERECIPHYFSSPHSPKQNPFVERVIRTIIDEHYSYVGLETKIESHQFELEKYLKFYNEDRPHRSLDNHTPMGYLAMIQSNISPHT